MPRGSEPQESAIACPPGRTKQSERDGADINLLMARYRKASEIPSIASRMPQYGDFTNTDDFQSAQNKIVDAHRVFMELPSHIRDLVDNDPGKFIEYVNDPLNSEALVKLGLAEAKSVPTEKEIPDPDAKPKEPPPIVPDGPGGGMSG